MQLLIGDQLDAQFFYIIRLFQSSICFEQTRAHHQEVNCINTASGIVTLKTSEWSKITKIQFSCIATMQLNCILVILDHSLVFRVTIPDAVLTFRHRASCILGQAFRYSPENAFYIFNQQIYFII